MSSQLTINQKKPIYASIMAIFCFHLLLADEASIISRDNWSFNEVNATASSVPSKLKFFKYYDMLPDQIVLPIVSNRDLGEHEGKNIFIGYGVADPTEEGCRVFEASITGLPNDVKICLPWWRIEREYEKQVLPVSDVLGLLCSLPTPKPPITVNVCKQWSSDLTISTGGGKVTCTSYYDKLAGGGCWDNPNSQECFVNNCSQYTQEHCAQEGANMGDVTDLIGAKIESTNAYQSIATKVNLVTYQYKCPAGIFIPNTNCVEEESVMMYPYECKADDPNTTTNEEEYTYCDESKAQYDANGKIIGFLGTCKDGKEILCEVNKFAATERQCTQDITQDFTNLNYTQEVNYRTFDEFEVAVLSGEPDIYSEKENCLRINTIEDARDQLIYATIQGNGGIDDDIYVLKHNQDGTHYKIYCNMQHSWNNGSKKSYNNNILQCIGNNGNYSFKENISIEPTTIVSIQQNTEAEDSSPTHFYARTHYGATEVKIDGTVAAPATFQGPIGFNGYPGGAYNTGYPHWNGKGLLNLWDNSTATLSIMFPYAGAYQLFFYDKNGNEVVNHTVDTSDFLDMDGSFIQLNNLGSKMKYRPEFKPDADDACLQDDFLEIGGGVWGGRDSKTGTKTCQNAPTSNDYIKEHAIQSILVVDLLTGNTTPIEMVYPLGYINRVFVSKLKIYEKRKYRCYKPFTEVKVAQ